MRTRLIRRAAAATTALALGGVGLIGIGATAASAADTITPGPLYGGSFYLDNLTTGVGVDPGTDTVTWGITSDEVHALPAPGDYTSPLVPTPPTANQMQVFLSPQGSEENPNAWNAYATYSNTVSYYLNVTPQSLNLAVQGATPSGQAAVQLAGGDYSLGFAFLNGSILLKEYYVHISVTPGSGDFTYEPVQAPVDTTPTQTTVTSAPSTVESGASFDLTATVDPSAATGTVTFKNGTTTLGTAPVQADGTATLTGATIANATTSSVTASITAVYSGDASYETSTSSAVTFPVTPGPIATTTAVTATSTSGEPNSPVVLKAVVSPVSSSGAGSVVFTGSVDGGAPTAITGTIPVDASGVAQTTISSLGAGSWTIDAAFTGVAPYLDSASTTPASLSLTPGDGTGTGTGTSTDPQDVTVTIPAGTLTITTPWTAAAPLDLGTATLDDATSTYFTAPKEFGSATDQAKGIQIIDRREGTPGFHAQVSSTDFTSDADSFPASHLGLVNLADHQVTGNTLQASDVSVQDLPANSPGLLTTAQTFATYESGHATGTAWISGDVELKGIPSSVQPGEYRATLTFTVL